MYVVGEIGRAGLPLGPQRADVVRLVPHLPVAHQRQRGAVPVGAVGIERAGVADRRGVHERAPVGDARGPRVKVRLAATAAVGARPARGAPERQHDVGAVGGAIGDQAVEVLPLVLGRARVARLARARRRDLVPVDVVADDLPAQRRHVVPEGGVVLRLVRGVEEADHQGVRAPGTGHRRRERGERDKARDHPAADHAYVNLTPCCASRLDGRRASSLPSALVPWTSICASFAISSRSPRSCTSRARRSGCTSRSPR